MQNKKEESNFFRTGTFRRRRNFSVTSIFGSNNSNNKLRMKKKVSIGLISGPLGDVRHTAHVGHSDGDVFGDTTFLQKEISSVNNQSQGGSRASTGSSTSSIVQSGNSSIVQSGSSSIVQSQMSIPQIDGNIATIRRNGKHVNKNIKYKRSSIEIAPQKQTVSQQHQKAPREMSPRETSPQQVVTSPGRHMTSSYDRMSIYEGWKFPDLGSDSLLEEVLKIMDQKSDL